MKFSALETRLLKCMKKHPENINVSFPVKFGVIADIKNMETLFSCFYKKLNGGKTVNGADYCIAVPTDVTEVDETCIL